MQGGTLNNQAGALYDIIDDSHISFTLSAGTINNAGLFRKSGGSGMSYIGGSAMNNTGTISVSSGTLRFHAGGSLNGGAMNISGGALVQLEHGDFSVVGTNTASGSGTFEINGGHVFAANGVSSSFANFTGGTNLVVTAGLLEAKLGGVLTLNLTGTSSVQLSGDPTASGGTIGGQGTTLNTGNFQWVHGMVVGKLTNSSANFTITNGGQSIFNSGVLTNTNTISQSNGSDMQMYQGGTISNQAGALWQMTGTNDIEDGFQGGPINNAGTWRKSGGSGTSTIAAPFNNSGTLAVDSGTLFFAGSELLNLTSPSKLSFKLSGLTPATDYGKLTT
jgi:hypothetical protein